MDKIETAVTQFKRGFSCSQAIFSTYATQFGFDEPTALKISASFGGGMARLGETCGAVTGAMLILGLKYGAISATDKETKEHNYAQCRELVSQFIARNKSIRCKDLLGCDISTPEGYKLAADKMLFRTICPNLVKDAAEILEQLIL
jgi:C_GCAxxG_C_C family probable redox protein